jgi:hypothetical protein
MTTERNWFLVMVGAFLWVIGFLALSATTLFFIGAVKFAWGLI